jgi:hypothetical protein
MKTKSGLQKGTSLIRGYKRGHHWLCLNPCKVRRMLGLARSAWHRYKMPDGNFTIATDGFECRLSTGAQNTS